MADGFVYDTSELDRFGTRLETVKGRITGNVGKALRKMSEYTQRKMKVYTRFNGSSQSTGRLRNSIRLDYLISKDNATSEIYVPEDIKYQFAAEYGIRRRQTIYGSPTMTFPSAHWKKAQRLTVAVPLRGYFVFTKIERGRYKGKFFTKRAFDSLNKYYETRIKEQLPNDIIFSITR